MASKTQISNLALVRIGSSLQLVDVDTDTTREALTLKLIFGDERDFVLRDFPWPWATKYKLLDIIDGDQVATNRLSHANEDWVFAYKYPSDCLFARRIMTPSGRKEAKGAPFRSGRDYEAINSATWPDWPDSAITMTSSTGAGWTTADTITATASKAMFAATDVGSAVKLTSGADTVTITIVTFVSSTVVSGTPSITVPASLRSAAKTTWTLLYDGRILWTDQEDAVLEYTFAVTDAAEFDPAFVSMLAWRLSAMSALSLARDRKLHTYCLDMYAFEKAKAEAQALNEGHRDPHLEAEWIRERTGSGTASSAHDWAAEPDAL